MVRRGKGVIHDKGKEKGRKSEGKGDVSIFSERKRGKEKGDVSIFSWKMILWCILAMK